ncbi:Branchpoint-bridging protein [Phanerochaete sordida]|uniref:Branchpoint-bridging protein n=1 Tax=Phanerochaete sordida TaxID=48140 RepID=A0A9P3GIG6_9APHY|nr:Branchpoint-bridging protein [Phanerochaete sordida]
MWRPATREVSGTNEIPLGNRRRFGPAPVEDHAPPQLAQPSPSAYPRAPPSDRDGPRQSRDDSPTSNSATPDPNQPRKRRSRWGDAKTEIPGLPTAISANGVSQAHLDNYAIHLRLEEINRKLRMNDFIPPEKERSPSPPPTYDSHGRRTNTREVRYRKKLEDERIKLVDRAMKNDPNFRPPVEYHQQKRSQRPSEKVYIPVKEFPEINFFGLLVGPRGNSLKKMERDSGAKISIRGKGSVKEGKARPEQYAEDAEEDLHCLVTADSPEKVALCVKLINRVIETAASTPEGQNDHKRNQLRELAALNGTLRDDENQICQNCGGVGHRKYDCPEQRNFTANIICRVCGSAGHMARDCTVNRDPNAALHATPPMKGGFDSEYASLMAELGETGKGPGGDSKPWTGSAGHDITAGGSNIPPWRRPEVWQTAIPPPQNAGYRPPQGGYSGPYGSGPDNGYGGASGYGQGYGGGQGYYQQPGADYSSNYAQYYQNQYAQQAPAPAH